jgi:hypothetical protein
MTKSPGRDEQMYCTAGVLVSSGQLPYRDFSYPSQLPYHPLILAAIYRSSGTQYYLLAGRIFSVVCDLLVMTLIVYGYYKLNGGQGLIPGLLLATCYLLHPIVAYANGHAWNHDLVQAAVMAAYALSFDLGGRVLKDGLKGVAMGVVLGLACLSRVTTVLAVPLFLGALAIRKVSYANRSAALIGLVAGLALVSIWPVWVILQAPRAFWLNLVQIPRLYGRWLTELGMTHDKLVLTVQSILLPENLVLLAGGLATAVALGRACLRPWLPLGLVAVFCIVAFIPPTMWVQYWAIPVPFALLWLARPVHLLWYRVSKRWVCRTVLWSLLGLLLLGNRRTLQQLAGLVRPDQWVPIALHNRYRRLCTDLGPQDRILTLGPLWALEAGCQAYQELSCGSIVYRIADQLGPEQRQLARVVGPDSLAQMVQTMPPAAVLIGVEDQRFAFLESPLLAAVGKDWIRRQTEGNAVLWMRPPGP